MQSPTEIGMERITYTKKREKKFETALNKIRRREHVGGKRAGLNPYCKIMQRFGPKKNQGIGIKTKAMPTPSKNKGEKVMGKG